MRAVPLISELKKHLQKMGSLQKDKADSLCLFFSFPLLICHGTRRCLLDAVPPMWAEMCLHIINKVCGFLLQ